MEYTHRFENRHVLITGAARGIGFEIARQFALEGAVLSLLDFHQDNLNNALEELKKIATAAYAYNVDVSNRLLVQAAVAQADAIQPIDVLINNAGIALETPFLDIEEREWKK